MIFVRAETMIFGEIEASISVGIETMISGEMKICLSACISGETEVVLCCAWITNCGDEFQVAIICRVMDIATSAGREAVVLFSCSFRKISTIHGENTLANVLAS